MKKIIQCGLAFAVLATVFVANARAADPIADLNAIAEKAIKASKHPLPVTSVEYAIVQLAIYDAVNRIVVLTTNYHDPPGLYSSREIVGKERANEIQESSTRPDFHPDIRGVAAGRALASACIRERTDA